LQKTKDKGVEILHGMKKNLNVALNQPILKWMVADTNALKLNSYGGEGIPFSD
jgi:hypothetical protein